MPDGLRQQLPLIEEVTSLMGISIIANATFEADDLLASFAVKQALAGHSIAIASSDKDFCQIISDRIIQWCPPSSSRGARDWHPFDRHGVYEKFGVFPESMVDYLSLVGDAADNIDGIPGVGPKTAAQWLRQWGSIDNLLSSPSLPLAMKKKLHGQELLLRRNQSLIHFDLSLPLSFPPAEEQQPTALRDFFQRFEMLSLLPPTNAHFANLCLF